MAMMYEILKIGGKKGGTRVGGIPEQKDYLVQQLTSVMELGKVMELPCHVVVTGHLARVKDEVSGGFESGLLLWGKQADQTPLVFDEKYLAVVTNKGHFLQTHTDGFYKAETRIGGDLFDTFEEPNLKALMKKAGIPCEDKPPLASLGGGDKAKGDERKP